MDDVFVYNTRLPDGISEMIVPCYEGYTLYIDEGLDEAHKARAYRHALNHVRKRDFDGDDVQIIEEIGHQK